MKTKSSWALLFLMLAGIGCKDGNRVPPSPSVVSQGAPSADPLADHVFPPELVMQHQAELQLTSDQQRTVVTAIQTTQSEMVDLQWKMIAARDALFAALDADPVDERLVLERADALFDLERNVKRRQIRLLVQVKNTLTPTQRSTLREIRRPH